jgi:AcrR family transcriptional regulator
MVHPHRNTACGTVVPVPKRVDHDERRRQIATSVWRIAAERGLPAATLRAVATDAGVSMRLVQYYFPAKDDLRVFAFEEVVRLQGQRMRERFAALGRPPQPAEFLRICLLEVLPTDDESRMLSRVHAAYYAAALTDPALAAAAERTPQDAMGSVLADQIRAGQDAGTVDPTVDPLQEARGLVALVAGLASMMLVGGRTVAEAEAVLNYRLDRLLAPARRRAPRRDPRSA